ncbi:MAG TPA: hypothetical protein VKK79_03190 [Candidatus Lokiarchaeia archaeon]|nr:hypothetical protein [Candidatus Lokiarchaeia archaeon]
MESPTLTPTKEIDAEKLTPMPVNDPTQLSCSGCRGQMPAEYWKKYFW